MDTKAEMKFGDISIAEANDMFFEAGADAMLGAIVKSILDKEEGK